MPYESTLTTINNQLEIQQHTKVGRPTITVLNNTEPEINFPLHRKSSSWKMQKEASENLYGKEILPDY